MTIPNGPIGPDGQRPPWWPPSPFDPPGETFPHVPEPRPVWWPPHLAWPPVTEPPVEVLYPPPVYTWPRLPPDHPYHLPPGYSYPNNLPPGHPGRNVPLPPGWPRRKVRPEDIVDSGNDSDVVI